MWDLAIHPLKIPTFLLTHLPVSGYDTIYNISTPQLINIVRFGPLRIAITLTIFKNVY